MPDDVNVNLEQHAWDGWEVFDHPQQNAQVNVPQQDNSVLAEVDHVEEHDGREINLQLPQGEPGQNRVQDRRQTNFEANRSQFALLAAQEKIDALNESEELRACLKTVLADMLKKEAMQNQLAQMKSVVEDLEPMLTTLVEKETQNFKLLDAVVKLGRLEAVKVLAEGLGVTEEAVERDSGEALRRKLSDMRNRFLLAVARDPKTGIVTGAELSKVSNEGSSELKLFAKTLLPVCRAICFVREKIDGLTEETAELRSGLTSVLEKVLKKETMQARLSQVENIDDLKPMLTKLVEVETTNVKLLDSGLTQTGRLDVIKGLAEELGVSQEEVARLLGTEFDQRLGELRNRLLTAAERNHETGLLAKDALAKVFIDGMKEITPLAKSCMASFIGHEAQATPRVKGALEIFLTGGAKREALAEAVRQVAGESLRENPRSVAWARTLSEVELQPQEKINWREAVRILQVAEAEYNVQEVSNFIENTVKDQELSEALGLPELMQAKQPLTDELRADLEARLEVLRPGAQKMREAVTAWKQQPPFSVRKLPDSFWWEVSAMASRMIQKGRVADVYIGVLRAKVEELLTAETNLKATLSVIEERNPGLTDQQKRLLRETLQYLQRAMPYENIKAYSDAVQQVLAVVSGRDRAAVLDTRAPEREQLAFLKAYSLTWCDYPVMKVLLKEKKAEITALFAQKKGQPSVNEVLRTVLGSKVKISSQRSLRELKNEITDVIEKAFCQRLLKRWPQFQTVYDQLWQSNEGANRTKAEVEKDTIGTLPQAPDWERFFVFQMDAGVKVSAGFEKFLGANKLELDDFVEPPKITLVAAGDKENAEHQFISDFTRGGEAMSCEVQTGNGSVKVSGRLDDFPSPEDKNRFAQIQVSSKSLSVFKAVEGLCAGNEMQYRLAMQTMSQGGIRSMTTLLLGGEGRGTPLAYHVKKEGENIVITGKSSNENDVNGVDATVVIKPDGTAEYTKLTFTRRDKEQTVKMDDDSDVSWVELPQFVKPPVLV